MQHTLPGRDKRAVRHEGPKGSPRVQATAGVVGGGIAGIAAAVGLAERGVKVTLFETGDRLGGRVAAWPLDDERTMSRGFHAFFRQYYNLRNLLKRIDPELSVLVPIEDYPLQRPDGMKDSFTGLNPNPPWSVMQFVLRSPAFTPKTFVKVNVPAALELMRVRFPETYSKYDGESAAAFLDRLRFPDAARDLALEVFARSFFADPSEFAAGELIAMFHTYFIGSAEGLLFDVPNDDYDAVLWAPLADYLRGLGVEIRTGTTVDSVEPGDDGAAVVVDGVRLHYDGVVIAADPRRARALLADTDLPEQWRRQVADTVNAPPFVVVRLWLDRLVNADRPAFLGTSGYGPLDNVSVLERFEAGAARWSKENGGSVVELHAYAAPDDTASSSEAADAVVAQLEDELYRVFPETRDAGVVHREVLVEDDCTLIRPTGWDQRPTISTPSPSVKLAGDWVRCDYPVALMERAATTGFIAANELLARWNGQGHDLWTVPMRGLLAGRR
ncbi:FAD-dependent oxidoreductase [Tessaracoccus flavus]|uniref:Isorenieratene synthase n=1 Tax=Tessaracoccus flavus TaxID=1610493 RepID=A0A1Q2CHQ9_9ACTN|nr:FAD-dependent oxidoreductase [Tessaracoccus flavus]AQP45644.1 isorenieratene synthase [Tessaracoccus flavus]SDY76397.1 isorenieratene synthase [Tessaracoccus flavus]